MSYNHEEIEKKWQRVWEEAKLFEVVDDPARRKLYILDMFPYPSAAGLHVGHPEGYTATDIVARKRMMQGFNVLHPMGFDAFGLPAENYALKTGVHPAVSTAANIQAMRTQIKRLGFTYDWSREVTTSDPSYYKWTQWIFLQLFKAGLVYKSIAPINWCPSCKTGLANEEVVEGKCDRCGALTVKKEIPQWMLKITAYADRLLEDLKLLDWPESIKEQQRNWIGRSEGARINFSVIARSATTKQSQGAPEIATPRHDVGARNDGRVIEVFTTRVDTLFGATYVVVAPEHALITQLLNYSITNAKEVNDYVTAAKMKSDLQRTMIAEAPTSRHQMASGVGVPTAERVGKKTGVELKGIKAVNPANGEELPVWVADYVLVSYGTGAVMAVPAHDQRDFEFAKKYGLGVKAVIQGDPSPCPLPQGEREKKREESSSSRLSLDGRGPADLPAEALAKAEGGGEGAFTADGVLVSSAQFSGMSSADARKAITQWLEEQGSAKPTVQYKLRDWVFSRQRYWGEPIPLVFCEQCHKKLKANPKSEILNSKKLQATSYKLSAGEILNPGYIPVPEDQLPLELPSVERYEPTGTGESPLAAITSWVNTTCPKCRGSAKRETNTMPQWAGSCWYYLAFAMGLGKTPSPQPSPARGEGGMQYPRLSLHTGPSRSMYSLRGPADLPAEALAKAEGGGEGSNWDRAKLDYWLNPHGVDLYVGGAEHAVLHLLYARFWHKFLFDKGFVPGPEPFYKLLNQGLILGEGGVKMSKSLGNVVNPDDVIKEYGADTLRMYEMFMGPFSDSKPWSTKGIVGIRRFLEKVWRLSSHVIAIPPWREKQSQASPEIATPLDKLGARNDKLMKLLHKTIKKVGDDIDTFKFNTAISSLMVLTNEMAKEPQLPSTYYVLLLTLLGPFAPHITEELWEMFRSLTSVPTGHHPKGDKLQPTTFLIQQPWPQYDPALIIEDTVIYIVQVNAKMRDQITTTVEITQEELTKLALASPKVQAHLKGATPRQVIFVKGRLINLVI